MLKSLVVAALVVGMSMLAQTSHTALVTTSAQSQATIGAIPSNVSSSSVISSCPSVANSTLSAETSTSFTQMSSSNKYTLSASGEEIQGQVCRRILIFQDSQNATIQVVINPSTLSIYTINYSAPIRTRFSTYNTPIWAGFEATSSSQMYGSEMKAVTMENIGSPNPTNNGDGCCQVAVWTGLGDAHEANDGILIQAGFTSTNGIFGNSLFMWYEALPASPTPITSGGCFQINYGDQAYVYDTWSTYYSYSFSFDDNDPNTSCSILINYTYNSLYTSTYAYFVGEDPQNSNSCTFSNSGVSNICELASWSTAYPYTGLTERGGTWQGFNSGNTVNKLYLDEGCGRNVSPSTISSGDYFTITYNNSDQQGYQC